MGSSEHCLPFRPACKFPFLLAVAGSDVPSRAVRDRHAQLPSPFIRALPSPRPGHSVFQSPADPGLARQGHPRTQAGWRGTPIRPSRPPQATWRAFRARASEGCYDGSKRRPKWSVSRDTGRGFRPPKQPSLPLCTQQRRDGETARKDPSGTTGCVVNVRHPTVQPDTQTHAWAQHGSTELPLGSARRVPAAVHRAKPCVQMSLFTVWSCKKVIIIIIIIN